MPTSPISSPPFDAGEPDPHPSSTSRGATVRTVELEDFHAGPVSLSRRVPLLENLGFRVISGRTYDIAVHRRRVRARLVVLHDMELVNRDGRPINLEKMGPMLGSLSRRLERADRGRHLQPPDPAGRADGREVTVLRAYARYLRQTGITYSQAISPRR